MKYFIAILFCVVATSSGLRAQQIHTQVVNSVGNSHNVGNMTIEYSVGEVAIHDYTIGNAMLTEGLLQPLYLPTGITEDILAPGIRIYPNPAVDVLNMETLRTDIAQVGLFDMEGRLIFQSSYKPQITLPNLAAGQYILAFYGLGQVFLGKETIQVVKR